MTSTDTTIFVGPTTGGPIHRLIADAPVSRVAVSPDGRFIASDDDGTIRLWPTRPTLHDLPHEEPLETLKTRLGVAANHLDHMSGPKGRPSPEGTVSGMGEPPRPGKG